MRIKIASRQSDLAKIQAYQVAHELQVKNPGLQVEFHFRASLGDINQNDPLWKMPERGVFTEDFILDLENETADLVVHSWKDLPTEPRKNTKIVATLPRADMRDVFLFRKDRFAQATSVAGPRLRILTSSPRRAYNLEPFLMQHLPIVPGAIEFAAVRGNVPTRLRKLVSEDADCLVVAKAALDRLLESKHDEFSESRKSIREVLSRCQFMVLPLSANPTAAAQGALAIEIKSTRAELEELCRSVHCDETYSAVILERQILSGYGGGCHQKIGVSVLTKDYGNVLFLRGLTDKGEILNQANISRDLKKQSVPEDQLWPEVQKENIFFNRQPIEVQKSEFEKANLVWVARANAWPEDLKLTEKIVWTAGLQTWKKLAQKGVWVHGTADSLGEGESPNIETLVGAKLKMAKLTHADSPESNEFVNISTYRLEPKASASEVAKQFKGKTHFFWSSGSAFDEAVKLAPEIKTANHACGPGNTYTHLRKVLGPDAKIEIYLSYNDWKDQLSSGSKS